MATPESRYPDPDTRIKDLVVILLRVGLGVNLLNAGLIGRVTMQVGSAPGSVNLLPPYAQIVLGLALILGLFTTAVTFGSGLLLVVQPLIQTAILMSGGYGSVGRGPLALQTILEAGNAPGTLLVVAAVLWFSTPGRNPWSLDALLFPQRDRHPTSRRTPAAPLEDLPAAPSPGERTARFLAGREE